MGEMSEWHPGAAERSYAQWYVWAKRNVSTSNINCHAAARAASLAEGGGEDPQAAARRTAASRSGPGWENPADERTRDYAELFDWSRLNLAGTADDQLRAATAGSRALAAGADREVAQSAARAELAPVLTAVAQPLQAPVPAAVAGPPSGVVSADGRYWFDGVGWRPMGVPALPAAYASFLRRAAALVIDALILNVVLGILYVPIDLAIFPGTPALADPFSSRSGIHLVVSIVVNYLYASLMLASASSNCEALRSPLPAAKLTR